MERKPKRAYLRLKRKSTTACHFGDKVAFEELTKLTSREPAPGVAHSFGKHQFATELAPEEEETEASLKDLRANREIPNPADLKARASRQPHGGQANKSSLVNELKSGGIVFSVPGNARAGKTIPAATKFQG